jgi:hypothetical protein
MITFVIKPDKGETFRVKADSRDVRLWERVSPQNTLRRIAENPNVDDYYSLSHLAMKRQRMPDIPSWDDYNENYAVAAVMDTEEVLNYDELVDVLGRAMAEPSASAFTLADAIVKMLDNLRMRALEPDPTRPGLLPGQSSL